MGRTAALLVVAALLAGACSKGSDDSEGDGSSVPTTPAPSTTPPLTTVGGTTEALSERIPLPPPATTPPTLSDAAGVDPDDLLAADPPPRFSFVELPDDTVEALNARFRQDDVVEEVLRGVSARGVRLDDRLIGVVVAVAVSPPVAADSDFQRSFQAQATADAEVEGAPLVVGDQEMVSFVAGDVHSALWQQDNVFIVVSSHDPDDLVRTASALVSTVVAPVVVPGDLDGDFIADPDGGDVPDTTAP